MLFAPGMRRLFATHPPLLERLKAIDPTFDASEIDAARAHLAAAHEPAETERAPASGRAAGAATIGPAALRSRSSWAWRRTRTCSARRVLREVLPEAVIAAGAHPGSARALLLSLALDVDAQSREQQKRFLAQQLGAEVIPETARLQAHVDALLPEQRLPALLRTLPALRQTPRVDRQRLLAALNAMLQRAGGASVSRYALRKLVQVNLRDESRPSGQAPRSAAQRRRERRAARVLRARSAWLPGRSRGAPCVRDRRSSSLSARAARLRRARAMAASRFRAEPPRPAGAAREGAIRRGAREDRSCTTSTRPSAKLSCCERFARRCTVRCRPSWLPRLRM